MVTTLNGRTIRNTSPEWAHNRLTLTSNHHVRPLVAYVDLPEEVRAGGMFDYIADNMADGFDFTQDARFVEFRGSWYDTNESELASDDFKALGWDSWQTESYFSAVLFRWFDADGYELDGVVVGYAHW